MLRDRKGQGYVEYVVLIGGVMGISGLIIGMFRSVGTLFTTVTGRLDTLNVGAGSGDGGFSDF